MNRKKILLVDDEANIRLTLSAVLAQAGYAVAVAEDGYAALRNIRDSKPDLVITDMRMPNMNGFELLSVLRTRFPELPTIAISGEFITIDINEGPLADAFFQKGNYSLSDFLARISSLLTGPRAHKPHTLAEVWAPTGNAPVMLTCTSCLRSFPIDLCESSTPPRHTDCILCGEHLDIQLVAIGVAQTQ